MRWNTRRKLRSFLTSTIRATMARSTARRDSTSSSPLDTIEGLIQEVDPVSRAVTVLVQGDCVRFYVPLDCAILLNDEHVKLRLLQPMDFAHVVFAQEQGNKVAKAITVHWDSPSPETLVPEAAAQHPVGLMECT